MLQYVLRQKNFNYSDFVKPVLQCVEMGMFGSGIGNVPLKTNQGKQNTSQKIY